MSSDYDDEAEDPKCPFCHSAGNCRHLLLLVDTTFRTADGGILKDAFDDRWSAVLEQADPNTDERTPFERLLEEVESLSDATAEYENEGGPGMSSTYAIYFIESESKAQHALEQFLSQRQGK